MGLLKRLQTTDSFKRMPVHDGLVVIEGRRLKALQSVLLMMLDDVLTVCEAESIPMTLGGGTCLGAVRHHGFIPWDDDIDINMTRKGYERFRSVFLEKYGQKYDVLDPARTDDYPVICPQIRLKGTVVRTREDFRSDRCGAFIDVCIIEDIPSSPILRTAQGLGSLALGLLASCRRFAQHKDHYLQLAEGSDDVTASVKLKARIGSLLFFTTFGALNRAWDSLNSACRNDASTFISIPGGRKHYFGEMLRRDDYFPVSYGEFEGLRVPLPKDPDFYLRSLYGDSYMTPPPKSAREKHVVLEFDLGRFGVSDMGKSGVDDVR